MSDHVDRYAKAAFDHARARLPLEVWKQHFREFEEVALAAKDAELAKLRDALEPFAKVAEHDIGESETDDDLFRPMMQHNRAPRLTVGDMRKALAALAGGSDA